MNTTIADINGSVFEEKRLELEISREDLAKSVCLNANQIRQIETGGQVSFYSFAQKLRSAKKVAEYLQIPEELAFTYKTIEVVPTPAAEISLKEVLNAEPELKSTQVTKSKNKPTAPLLVGALLLTISLSFWIYSGDVNNSTVVAKENGGDKILVSAPEKERPPSAPNQEVAAISITACDIPEPANITEIQVKNPQYVGDSISVRANKNMDICILDGSSEKRRYELEENTRKVISVRSKFIILGQDLTDLRLYYQGERIDVNANLKNALSIRANSAYPTK